MSELIGYFTEAVACGASDIFLVPGSPVCCKLDGTLVQLKGPRLVPDQTAALIQEIYSLAQRDIQPFLLSGDDDFSFAVAKLARFRVNAYRQRGSLAAVVRIVAFSIPDPAQLHIPDEVMSLSELKAGMVIFSGVAGCGKTTTQACIIDKINRERACHIVTLEDPIEYLHRNQKSIVSQREIAVDTKDCLCALRACLRQSPDVIQLGEMRDLDTVRTAMTAAETGHLLLATLHTHGAVNTIGRIIDIFPADQQNQIRIQMSGVLHTVVSQQLLPDVDGGLVPAFEILHLTPAVRSMIRDQRDHQIAAAIASGGSSGMVSMDQSILRLYRSGRITRQTALAHADDPANLQRLLDQK